MAQINCKCLFIGGSQHRNCRIVDTRRDCVSVEEYETSEISDIAVHRSVVKPVIENYRRVLLVTGECVYALNDMSDKELAEYI